MVCLTRYLLIAYLLIFTSVSADLLTIINESSTPLYVATYYESGNSATIKGKPVQVPATTTIQIERPRQKLLVDRELICALSSNGLTNIITPPVRATMAKTAIGNLHGSTFHIATKHGNAKVYDAIDWQLKHVDDWFDAKLTALKETFCHHQYATSVATVSRNTALGQQETDYLAQRAPIVQQTLEQVLGTIIAEDELPRIAICMSGGGMRAAMCAYALIEGLRQLRLINALTYAAALSGSTWTLAQWISSGASVKQLHDTMITALTKPDLFNPSILAESLWVKTLFGQHTSIVDLYGVYLANTFMNFVQQESDRQKVTLSMLQARVEQGAWPFPLFTAGETTKDFHWCTFTPYEFRCETLGITIPAWAFGRRFNRGNSIDCAPEFPLGFMMGLWGSALSGSLEEMFNTVKPTLNSTLAGALDTILLDTGIGNIRPAAIKIGNPLYHIPDAPFSDRRHLIFIDGGYGSNIPLVPLMHQDRHLDIIFVLDASENVHDGAPDFMNALQQVRTLGVPLPSVDPKVLLSKPISIIQDPNNAAVPTIIYVAPIKNNNYDQSFDPAKEITSTYATSNFVYNQKVVEKMVGLITFNLVEQKDRILDAIQQRIAMK